MKLNGIVIMIITLLLLINIYWSWYFYPKWFPHEVNIPTETQINNFCRSKGFDWGWLSSTSCKENEVMCHAKIFDLDKYECVKWGVVE